MKGMYSVEMRYAGYMSVVWAGHADGPADAIAKAHEEMDIQEVERELNGD